MKKLFVTLISIALLSPAFAQLDRSVRPEPAASTALDFGEYEIYTLKNGMKIIVVENHKLPRVTASLIIDRQSLLEGEKAGYVSMTGELLRQGTTNRPKEQLDEEIDFIGARLSTGSSSIYVSGLSKYTEKLVDLLADVALNPAFPQDEFDKIKKQNLSSIENAKDSPDQLSTRLFGSTTYHLDHPYGELISEATINNVTLEDCKNYYNTYWAPNKAYIAIVGDVKPKKIKKLLKNAFKEWEMKEVPAHTYDAPAVPESNIVSIINRSNSAQTVLRIGNTIDLKPGSEDIVKIRLANQILGGGSIGRLFKNIREDKAYTYGAYSSYSDDEIIGQFSASASVRTEVTDSAVTEFLYEIDRMRNELVSEEDLQASKNFINGSFGRSLESPQTIANFALNIQRYNLADDYYENYLKRLNALSAEDVKAAANKYMKYGNLNITAVGKASDFGSKLEKFGEVKYYDFEGNETEAPSLPLPDGLTANTVIANYIKAIGGQENLNKVRDISITMNAEIAQLPPGMTATASIKRLRPNLMLSETSVSGMGVVQKQVFDGKTAKVSGMQGEQTLEGDDLEDMKESGIFFKESQYEKLGCSLELVAMEVLEGEKAYLVEVSKDGEVSHTEYYSAETGLKIAEAKTSENPMDGSQMTQMQNYSDYKEVNGVLFPHKTVISGMQKITLSVQDLKVNSGLKESDFK